MVDGDAEMEGKDGGRRKGRCKGRITRVDEVDRR